MKRIFTAALCGAMLLASAISAGAVNVNMYFNGAPMELDTPAQIINNRTMVPIGPIMNALEAEVTWDGTTRTAVGEKDGTRVVIQIDNTTAYVNDAPVELDTPAMIVNNRTMVPAWFVSDAFGATVTWDGATSSVYIEMPQEDPAPAVDPEPQPEVPVKTEGTYVGSLESDKYHNPGCRFAENILPENEIWFDTEEEAQAAGYEPCGVCQ